MKSAKPFHLHCKLQFLTIKRFLFFSFNAEKQTKQIMMNDAEISRHQIFTSIFGNDLSGLQTLLKINPDHLECMDECSNTPLLYACYCGRSPLVDYLLAFGANHQQLNIFGKYTLHPKSKYHMILKHSNDILKNIICNMRIFSKAKMLLHWLRIRAILRHATYFWTM